MIAGFIGQYTATKMHWKPLNGELLAAAPTAFFQMI